MAKLPLAVDLDGTLIHGDVFIDAILAMAGRKPWLLPLFAIWMLKGRANAKARLSRIFPTDPASLRYDERVVSWLKAERAQGRIIALATASDRSSAEAVMAHLKVFDAVFASDGVVNLKSHRKAAALAAAYPQGFVYAGNESADLKVWAAAAAIAIVNAPDWLERSASARFVVEKLIPREKNAS